MDNKYFSGIKEFENNILEFRKKEYVGDAGAGMVKVTITGDLRVINVEIDHSVFAKTAPEIIKDLDFLSDLFKAAVNQAIDKSSNDLQNYGLQNIQF